MLTPNDIRKALHAITQDIADIHIESQGKVRVLVGLAPERRAHAAALQAACERTLGALEGVNGVSVIVTSETDGNVPPVKKAVWNKEPIAGVKRVVAVASGKGGVGKSTTAVNLAHALAAQGKRVGLLDADIYGPSLPRMMGLSGTPDAIEGKIIPPAAHGIKCMSMGLLVGEGAALVWRGPQMSKALHQLLRGVAWGELDLLLIDMPPGTGDVHLSLVQQAPVDGVIIVTTPQDVAVADARKCIDMFHKVSVPVLGVIENMSGFRDPAGTVHAIFGAGGGKALAAEAGASFLGEIPIEIALREASDTGAKFKDTGIYAAIAKKL